MATFILIHGSFHGAWNWHKVIPLIEQSGHKALALDMPGHGLDTTPVHKVTFRQCVNKVKGLIDTIKGEVVLVAHSRNGMIISQVAEERANRIKKLIYIAAYLIPNGKSMMHFGIQDKESLVYQHVFPKVIESRVLKVLSLYKYKLLRKLLPLITPNSQKTHQLNSKVFKEALYHDCPTEITELANALLTEEPNFPGFEILQLSNKNYGKIPKTYIECLQDRAVTLKLQRMMQRASPCDYVYQLDSSHSPFFSMPEKLVDLLLVE